ncbi:Hypothetical predicted protein, partial [Olea europaea subsp. europaea]
NTEENGVAFTSSEPTINSETSLQLEKIGTSAESANNWSCREEFGREETHCLGLETPIFEVLIAPLQKNSEALMEGQIGNKLKLEVKTEKRVLQPKGLKRLVEMDDKNYLIQINGLE